jgi:4-amino-4-deoxy-L-arabinose transferase-like glycosyltransferase
VVSAGVAGIALRAWIYGSILGRPNSDESVVGLMVLHAMHGELTTFFWGSIYGGSQLVLLSVPFFWLGGVNYHALRVVPILLTAAAALLVWRVGCRTGGETVGIVAACLFWIWPPFNLFQLTQHQSFYGTNVFYCALLLLLSLRVAERPDRTRVALFGLVVGLAFWQSGQIVPVAVPMIAWLVWKVPRALRHAWLGAVMAVVGSLPFWVWNAMHGWESFTVHSSLDYYRTSLRLFVSPILPMTLGLRAPFTAEPFVPSRVLTHAVYATLLVLGAYGAYRYRERSASLLFLVAGAFPLVYAIDRRTTFFTAWPQYTVVVTPVIALLLAHLCTRYWRAVAVLAVAGAMTVVAIPRMQSWFHEEQPVPFAPRDFSPLIATLDSLGLDHVYADYWIAYRLDFATRERIVAVENPFDSVTFRDGQAVVPTAADPHVRFRPYEREVAASRHGFVFFERTADEIAIVPALERHGYTPHVVEPFVVYAPPAAA